jgi:nitronate monooxygenase
MPANGHKGKSWQTTRVADLLGIDYPIIQAPFGGFASQHLTATVSNLGGLGSLGALTLSGPAIREAVDEIRTLTNKPFAVNLWVSTADRQASHIHSEVTENKIRELARYYAELGIEPPCKVEVRSQDFEAQVHAVIDAGARVLSFIYGVPPLEIERAMVGDLSVTEELREHVWANH